MSHWCRARAETPLEPIWLDTSTPPPQRWTCWLVKLLLLALWICSLAPTGPWSTPDLAGPCLWLQDQRARTHNVDATTHAKWPLGQRVRADGLEAGSASLHGAPAALSPHQTPGPPSASQPTAFDMLVASGV
jgi:hypothetical protein